MNQLHIFIGERERMEHHLTIIRPPPVRLLDRARRRVAIAGFRRRKSAGVDRPQRAGEVEETAEVLNVLADTVMRDWRLARSWLLAEVGQKS